MAPLNRRQQWPSLFWIKRLFEDLKRKYLASFEEKVKHIKGALESQDLQVLSTAIHQLAGSSGSYGFTALSELCLKIEQLLSDEADFKTQIEPEIRTLITDMNELRFGLDP